MDTSGTYYKMCSKAFPEDALNGTAFKTQDQLQEMMGEYNLLKFWGQFFSIADYVIHTEYGFELPQWAKHCESWEQLWLAFVMFECYQKIWDGSEWIKRRQ